MLKIICFENEQELAKCAAGEIASLLREKPTAVLGLATGSTPVETYKELCRMHAEEGLDFSKATSYNLDEYVGLPEGHSQSYRTFMEENLFSKVNIRKECTFIPDSTWKKGEDYDAAIAAAGGIDLQVLGIGQNGHIGFNEPGRTLPLPTHLAALTESTRRANARFFNSIDEVPEYAMSMGLGSIFAAKKILLLATGASKHDAVQFLKDGLVTTDVPATLLKLHPDAVLLCDKAAFGK